MPDDFIKIARHLSIELHRLDDLTSLNSYEINECQPTSTMNDKSQ